MKYLIVILMALFGVVSVAVVRTYQLNANTPAPPDATPYPASDLPNPVPTPNSPIIQAAPPQNSQAPFEIRGKISSVKGNVIVVNERTITLASDVAVKGKLKEKMNVDVKGYVRGDGVYIAQLVTSPGGGPADEGGD